MSQDIQAIIQSAEQAYQHGSFFSAAEHYEIAASKFRELNQPFEEAVQKNNASVCYLKADQALKALQVCENTDHIFADAGKPLNQALALGNQASALEKIGKLKDAADLYQKCIDLLKSNDGNDYLFQVYSELTGIQLRMRRYLQAIASMNAGLNYRDKLTFRQKLLRRLISIPIRMLKVG